MQFFLLFGGEDKRLRVGVQTKFIPIRPTRAQFRERSLKRHLECGWLLLAFRWLALWQGSFNPPQHHFRDFRRQRIPVSRFYQTVSQGLHRQSDQIRLVDLFTRATGHCKKLRQWLGPDELFAAGFELTGDGAAEQNRYRDIDGGVGQCGRQAVASASNAALCTTANCRLIRPSPARPAR